MDFPELVFISHIQKRCAELSHWLYVQLCSNFTNSHPTPMRSWMCTWWLDDSTHGTCFQTPNYQGQAQLCVQECGFLRLESAQTRPPEKTDDVGGTPRAGCLSETSAHDFPHAVQGDLFHRKTRISPFFLLTPLAPRPWLSSSLPCVDRAPCLLQE